MMMMTSPSVVCPWDIGDKDNTLQMITSIMRMMFRMMFKEMGLSDCHNMGLLMLIITLEIILMSIVIMS